MTTEGISTLRRLFILFGSITYDILINKNKHRDMNESAGELNDGVLDGITDMK